MEMTAYRYPITEDMLSPILDLLVANLDKLFPVLIGIFGFLLCLKVIPPIISYVLGR